VIRNSKNTLVPTRVQPGWHVCIDYRKLNATIRKDHFHLSFIGQMLERSTKHSYCCFLDGYSTYTQISITLEDQDKPIVIRSFYTFSFRRECHLVFVMLIPLLSIAWFLYFSKIIEQFIEMFMNDFFVFGFSFDDWLANMTTILQKI